MEILTTLELNGITYRVENSTDYWLADTIYAGYGFELYFRSMSPKFRRLLNRAGFGPASVLRPYLNADWGSSRYVESRRTEFDLAMFGGFTYALAWYDDDSYQMIVDWPLREIIVC